MKKLPFYDHQYYYKILMFLKRKPRSRQEAQEHLDKVYPGSGMKIDWKQREIGPYKWSGKLYNPILKRKISSCDTQGYDLSHGLMSWIFNRQRGGCGGIAGNVYGCLQGPVISHRQVQRMADFGE